MSETEVGQIPSIEPSDSVVLRWCEVPDGSLPRVDPPHREFEIGSSDLVDRRGCGKRDVDAELFSKLTDERIRTRLIPQHVTAWKVPDVWIPAPPGCPVAEKQAIA